MNKTTLITAVATAYATVAATSFAFGFMFGPKQALVDEPRLPAYTDQSATGGKDRRGGASGAIAIDQTSSFFNRQANSAAIAMESQQAR